jgi:hypothetical protein
MTSLESLDDCKSHQDVLNKRLKMLKKKLLKMENYPSNDLNPDQLLALERKPLIQFAIKELEELSKQFTMIEEIQQKKQILLDELNEQDILKRIQIAVEEASMIPKDHVKQLLSLLHTLFYTLEMSEFYLKPDMFDALSILKQTLSSDFDNAVIHVYKLLERSNETFAKSRYEDMVAALEKLSLPKTDSKLVFFTPSEIEKSAGMSLDMFMWVMMFYNRLVFMNS